jgi:hypothetical protein
MTSEGVLFPEGKDLQLFFLFLLALISINFIGFFKLTYLLLFLFNQIWRRNFKIGAEEAGVGGITIFHSRISSPLFIHPRLILPNFIGVIGINKIYSNVNVGRILIIEYLVLDFVNNYGLSLFEPI